MSATFLNTVDLFFHLLGMIATFSCRRSRSLVRSAPLWEVSDVDGQSEIEDCRYNRRKDDDEIGAGFALHARINTADQFVPEFYNS